MKKILFASVFLFVAFLLPVQKANAAISYVGGSNHGTADASVVLNNPSVTTGDVMIAVLYVFCIDPATAPASVTAPSGWIFFAGASNLSCGSSANYYKIATSSEPSTYTWLTPRTRPDYVNILSGALVAYRGVNTTIPIDANSYQGGYTAQSITTNAANDFVVGIFVATYGTSFTLSPTMTSRLVSISPPSISIYDVSQSSAGASGNVAATPSQNGTSGNSQLVALRPDQTSPSPSTTGASGLAVTFGQGILNGSTNPNGLASTGWFRYSLINPGTCNDSFGTRAPASSGTALGSGNTAGVAYSNTIAGLTAATTYYYCAISNNSQGTTFGSIQSFFVPSGNSCGSIPLTGTYAVSSSCVFPNSIIDGVDAGSSTINTAQLTINPGTTLSVGAGQTLAYGVISKPGAAIVKFTGGVLRKGPMWIPDSDGDGYPDAASANNQAFNTTQPANYVRRYFAQTLGADCATNDATRWSNRTGYADADGDGYSVSGASSVCSGSSLAAGYLASATGQTDCYDGNSNARPGQTAYFGGQRGDGSFDYDCNGGLALSPASTAYPNWYPTVYHFSGISGGVLVGCTRSGHDITARAQSTAYCGINVCTGYYSAFCYSVFTGQTRSDSACQTAVIGSQACPCYIDGQATAGTTITVACR